MKALEDALKSGVSPAERLRRLLQTQKQLEAKDVAAKAALNKQKVELAKATAAIKQRMNDCDEAASAMAANTLEIAEVTRSAAPANEPAPGVATDMCQDLRLQIETLLPSDLSEAGTDMAGMGQFFVMFSKIQALLERAKTREVAPPPVATAGTATPVAAVGTAAAPAAASSAAIALLQPSEIQPGQPNPFTQVLPADDEDSEDDPDETMAGAGAAERELAKAEKLLESFKTTEGGSCG